MAEVTLESEEWYVLCNWLRERENRLQYSLRPRSREWEFVHDLRREIERQRREIERQRKEIEPQRHEIEHQRRESEHQRRETERQRSEATDTKGTPQSVTLSPRQVKYLGSYLRRRARRLLVRPWRDRERRDVRHLRDHLLEEVGHSESD